MKKDKSQDDVADPMLSRTPFNSRKRLPLIIFSVALISSVLTFTITWAITSSMPVRVTFVNPNGTSAGAAPQVTATTDPRRSGQVALTEAELRLEVKTVGGKIYWTGPMAGALYTFNHISSSQNYIRYLPHGFGLADMQSNYRVIATYQDAKAYETMQAAGKLAAGVSITNPDGSLVYYAKATPTHVYLAYKNLGFQIEIFDPAPSQSLKLAITPNFIQAIL
jgi:hypothetical protein